MSAHYIVRLDDITPTMDWGRFDALMNLLTNHSIKPLLGVVPDNKDSSLNRQPARPDFWEILREMQDRDRIDIAQHGYQHILVPRPGAALLKHRTKRKNKSEFAGESYHDQVFKISEGNRILRSNGINTSFWMAPNHSFDQSTLRALADLGFTAVTDGLSLYPYLHQGLIFVPQQTWRPRWMPCGVQTICIHPNEITPQEIKRLRLFLRRPYHFARFSDVVCEYSRSSLQWAADCSFRALYLGASCLKPARRQPLEKVVRNREISTPLAATPPLPLHLGN